MRISDEYQYTILCEDKKTMHFIRNILIKQKVNTHKIHASIAPMGLGSGEAYVRMEYPKELKILRRFNYKKIVLIVCTDADLHEVTERKEWFATVCRENDEKIENRKEKELVMIWIPKRSIENWIEFFKYKSIGVSEETKYPHDGNPVDCKTEAKAMSDFLQGKIVYSTYLPSLIDAKQEYERLCENQK